MKNHTVDIPTTPPELIFAGISRRYDEYQEVRDTLHDPSTSSGDCHALFEKADGYKADIAEASSVAYRSIQETRPGDTGRVFNYMLFKAISADTEDAEKRFAEEYAAPMSPLHLGHTSPVESIVATTANKMIAQEFAKVADASPLTGLLISGANAWGAFYSVHGGRHPLLDTYAIPFARETDKRSDIDMLAVAPEVDDIGQAVEQYINAGLVPAFEKSRFDVFARMQAEGKVDVFSLRSYYKGVEQSIHFVPQPIIDGICNGETLSVVERGQDQINIVRDFRPNIPSCMKRGGYEITDLGGLNDEHFVPKLEEVPGLNGNSLGYIAESPVGGPFVKNGEPSYGMGLFPFFLSVKPDIISDTASYLAGSVATLKETIANTQQGIKPRKIMRAERMSKITLQQLLEELS